MKAKDIIWKPYKGDSPGTNVADGFLDENDKNPTFRIKCYDKNDFGVHVFTRGILEDSDQELVLENGASYPTITAAKAKAQDYLDKLSQRINEPRVEPIYHAQLEMLILELHGKIVRAIVQNLRRIGETFSAKDDEPLGIFQLMQKKLDGPRFVSIDSMGRVNPKSNQETNFHLLLENEEMTIDEAMYLLRELEEI